MSVRPCVRVSVRSRFRLASLPVSPVRPVLLLKTTCEKRKNSRPTADRPEPRERLSNLEAHGQKFVWDSSKTDVYTHDLSYA